MGAAKVNIAKIMNQDSTSAQSPVLIVPYVWIGDFVRCHSVVKLLRAQAPERPVDIVSSTLCAPLADYMPGIRDTIVIDLPRRRLGLSLQWHLAARLREGHYGQALVMSRKWKAALAPFLAGVPWRTGFAGEIRFGLLNDVRLGERKLPRMIDQMGALGFAERRKAAERMAAARVGRAAARSRGDWRKRHSLAARRSAGGDAFTGRGRRRQGLAHQPLWRIGACPHQGRRIRLGAGRAE